jgi:hypothetical protein
MTYPTIEPTSYRPSGMAPAAAVEVDSLTPTFSWKQPPADVMARMDLAVWEVNPDGSPGETYYSVRGFVGNQHTMTKPLEPGTEYFWSVKRSDSFQWAKANYVGVSPLGAAWQNGVPFKIKAPSSRAVSVSNAAPAQSTQAPQAAQLAQTSPSQDKGWGNASASTAGIPTPEAYAPWEPLIGGVWRAELESDNDGTPRHMERTYTWAENKRGVKVEGWDFRGNNRNNHVTGLVVWNASEGEFELQAVTSSGLTQKSIIHKLGDVLAAEITVTAEDGTVMKQRSWLRLVSPNVATFKLSQVNDGDVVEVLSLRLERLSQTGIIP